ncbi:MAG TPA: SDR family NAD(P)-dependent oxidoreductase [Candidatus Angelobacter sp.]|nr:SDR family NAD(P)-dependent oxidoreductase [Candidatus Angelobacter sp.]
MTQIAVIGMGCRYADVRSPMQLWENVLAQRRSFRRIPRVRLNLEDYSSASQSEDNITAVMAAVLDDYEFDRARFHISQTAFAATDLTHWLALDVAAQALADAKLLHANAEQRERTSVYVGNSLTGEFSRANLMRLRWPYVRRVLVAALEKSGQGRQENLAELMARVEELYKAPFPATNEESLAGGLSNTIAGRICNYFDFKGGGYTVDGACASSMLAITTACAALQAGDVDIAIAGGVDLSLDPFELAGFSSLGAIATKKMRVFDAQSSGFWPGEGCGMVVLMRYEDALARHHSPYAVIRGWGISSDGQGGITRPEVAGQILALRRAYEKAGYGIDSVSYFEGHGTGTSVGDAVELQALSQAMNGSYARTWPAAIGSVKANIGHTKAAAGVAGLIKATMAVQAKMLPPVTGCEHPHAELTANRAKLRVLREAELWPGNTQARAGVSGFGFGGINVHVTLEAPDATVRKSFIAAEKEMLFSVQDCELFIFSAEDADAMRRQLAETLGLAKEISYAELADLSIALAKNVHAANGTVRAGCVASSPDELVTGLENLLSWCDSAVTRRIDVQTGTFFAKPAAPPRIGFLFPGQASPVYINGGAWARRFTSLHDLYTKADLPRQQSVNTKTAQPCIATASLAGLQILRNFGINGDVAVGHSMGEIVALHWAGACTEQELLSIVHARGKAMAEAGDPSGGMASIRADYAEVVKRLNGDGLVVAARNAPSQTIVSGRAAAVQRFAEKLEKNGISATMLPVSHAFHSPLVADVATVFGEELEQRGFCQLTRRVISTVTGLPLGSETNLKILLAEQITKPVLFADALALASREADFFIEVGPGRVLSGIAGECTEKPVIALDAGSESLRGLLCAVGAAFVFGAQIRTQQLYEKRFGRPIDLRRKHSFLANPCETVPEAKSFSRPAAKQTTAIPAQAASAANANSALEVLLQLVAQRTQLSLSAIQPEHRFLTDLHLNSITISQIVLEAASLLSLPAPATPAEFTNATLAETAKTLEGLRTQSQPALSEKYPAGVDSWIRALGIELVEKTLPRGPARSQGEWQIVGAAEPAFLSTLREEFRSVAGRGLVCCVPQKFDEQSALFLLQSAQAALKENYSQIVFIQDGVGAGALARSLYLENPAMRVTVVNASLEHTDAARWTAAEANANQGFVEAHYDLAGVRREPRLKLLHPAASQTTNALGSADVLLVTGGGKGIAAESALQLAWLSGCRLALLGRSTPEKDDALRKNLDRIAANGVHYSYFAADVTDHNAVQSAVKKIRQEFGPITAILHGAGTNHPKRLEEITSDNLREVFAPKILGLQNVLSSIGPAELHLLITFGSIIARTGLHGEAHYGLANEWMAYEIERWQKAQPHCRCVNLDWSVWGGIGMGQRLGVLDSLIRQGITPLPINDAIQCLQTMLAWEHAPASAIITGRFGDLPTLKFEKPELPLLRFLEHTRLYTPGIELIADAELSIEKDPYVTEHVFQGEQLLPAVVGMEAMAQVAQALARSNALPGFKSLRFEHPIVVPRNKPVTIRTAALQTEPGKVSVVIRCSSTGFKIDHFSCECIFPENPAEITSKIERRETNTTYEKPPLDPAVDLYGNILFHHGRFARIQGYELLHFNESVARISAPSATPWFARHLSPELALGDPASRDAALHSIQGCIPHKTLLPIGIDRVSLFAEWSHAEVRVRAVERASQGENFIYDVQMEDTEGKICEQWEGLHLKAVAPIAVKTPWPLALLVPYLERKARELLHDQTIRIDLLHVKKETKEPRQNAIAASLREMFGADATLIHRGDGKPELIGIQGAVTHISISHAHDITLLITAKPNIGCDMEKIACRDAACWEKLLGKEDFALARMLEAQSHTAFASAAAQIWTLKESLRKVGADFGQPISLNSCSKDGWAIFSGGEFQAATTQINTSDSEYALGFVLQRNQ